MGLKRSPAIVRITNLRLQAVIGVNEWERHRLQDILINLEIRFDPAAAIDGDDLDATLDYKAIKKAIIAEVNNSSFHLLEKLTDHILKTVMLDSKVLSASVRVDKPRALRFADSVSIELSAERLP